ncbi:MAG: hypothetical protein F6K28_40470 [Microcoleus sp. SIO2G3]|nr:hypothetical protein [Microcoleus sp. SIO2G3]
MQPSKFLFAPEQLHCTTGRNILVIITPAIINSTISREEKIQRIPDDQTLEKGDRKTPVPHPFHNL